MGHLYVPLRLVPLLSSVHWPATIAIDLLEREDSFLRSRTILLPCTTIPAAVYYIVAIVLGISTFRCGCAEKFLTQFISFFSRRFLVMKGANKSTETQADPCNIQRTNNSLSCFTRFVFLFWNSIS